MIKEALEIIVDIMGILATAAVLVSFILATAFSINHGLGDIDGN